MTLVPKAEASAGSSRPAAARRACSGGFGIACSIPTMAWAVRASRRNSALGLLPGGQGAEEGLDGLLVADQVVVHNEGHAHALGAQGFQLGDDLGAGLEARAAAEGDDDVAELALEGAAARELHAAEQVVP